MRMQRPSAGVFRFFLVVLALLGCYFYAKQPKLQARTTTEGFQQQTGFRCPDLLVQKGTRFYLRNTKLATVPGVNPIVFESLDEYTQFMEWQKSQHIQCPILFLQAGVEADGSTSYTVRPDVWEPQGGMQTIESSSSSSNPHPFDAKNLAIGSHNPIDSQFHEGEKRGVSYNPMDSNWGGPEYTQQLVDSGYFAGNEVSIAVSKP